MVGRDGVIYVATGFPEPPTLHAVDPSGAIRWSTVLGDDEMAAPPVQTSDGSIYTSLWTYRFSRSHHLADAVQGLERRRLIARRLLRALSR